MEEGGEEREEFLEGDAEGGFGIYSFDGDVSWGFEREGVEEGDGGILGWKGQGRTYSRFDLLGLRID